MSFEMLQRVKKIALPPSHKVILLCLADAQHQEKPCCWPSLPTIAEYTCLEETTIRRAILDLETWGFLRRECVVGRGTKYFLTPEDGQAQRASRKSTPCATPTPGTTQGVAPCRGTPGTTQGDPLRHAGQTGSNRKEPEEKKQAAPARPALSDQRPAPHPLAAKAQAARRAPADPNDLKTILFEWGVQVLGDGGVPVERARPLVGKLVAAIGVERGLEAMERAQDAVDPRSYLMACAASRSVTGSRQVAL